MRVESAGDGPVTIPRHRQPVLTATRSAAATPAGPRTRPAPPRSPRPAPAAPTTARAPPAPGRPRRCTAQASRRSSRRTPAPAPRSRPLCRRGELRQQAQKERRHLRIGQVADHPLPQRPPRPHPLPRPGSRPTRSRGRPRGTRPVPGPPVGSVADPGTDARGCPQGLEAEGDQVGGAHGPHDQEGGLGRLDQLGDATLVARVQTAWPAATPAAVATPQRRPPARGAADRQGGVGAGTQITTAEIPRNAASWPSMAWPRTP